MSKAPYKTKQMAELLTFLESVQGKHVTVNEICDYFKEKGKRYERNYESKYTICFYKVDSGYVWLSFFRDGIRNISTDFRFFSNMGSFAKHICLCRIHAIYYDTDACKLCFSAYDVSDNNFC